MVASKASLIVTGQFSNGRRLLIIRFCPRHTIDVKIRIHMREKWIIQMIRLRLLLIIIRIIMLLVIIIMLLVMMICNEGRTSCCPELCRPSLNTNFTPLSLSLSLSLTST